MNLQMKFVDIRVSEVKVLRCSRNNVFSPYETINEMDEASILYREYYVVFFRVNLSEATNKFRGISKIKLKYVLYQYLGQNIIKIF